MRGLVLLILGISVAGCDTPPAVTHRSANASAKKKTPHLPDIEAKDSSAGTSTGSDWAKFLGPTGDGISPEKGIISPWPKEGLRVVWRKKVGTGYGTPAISKDQLYLFDRQANQARLRCLKSRTGEPLWTFEYPTNYTDSYGYNNGPRCCPVVDGDRVYVFGAEGVLHCVRAEDGKRVWKVNTQTEFGVIQNFFGVASVPVIEGNLLLVQVGGSPPGSDKVNFDELKGNKSGLVAFDKYTGKVKYRISDELASYASPVLATIQGRRWGFLFARGGLLGFEPSTGKVDFHFPWRAPDLESVNAANPVVVGDRVFISECYGPGSALLKVKPGSCQELWSDAAKAKKNKSLLAHWSTPIYHNGYLYGCNGRHPHQAELRCIELATGKVMWSQPGLARTSLLMVDGHFICLGEEGQLLLLKVNPNKYEQVSEMDTEKLLEYPCWAAPILSHGLLYIRGGDRLVCLELIPKKK
jgi:outer membrane protein assembly factor BamB